MLLTMRRKHALLIVAALLMAARPSSAQAPAPKLGSSNSTDLGLVIATGNARSTSIGLRNVYGFRFANAELKWEAGWLRVASRDGHRFAVGTPTIFTVTEPGTAIDSERLFSKLRYQRQLSTRTDWFTNFDTVRDDPANISHQVVLA